MGVLPCVLEGLVFSVATLGEWNFEDAGAYHKVIRSLGHPPQIWNPCCCTVGSHEGELSWRVKLAHFLVSGFVASFYVSHFDVSHHVVR